MTMTPEKVTTDLITLTIDGFEVSVPKGTLVIRAFEPAASQESNWSTGINQVPAGLVAGILPLLHMNQTCFGVRRRMSAASATV